VLVGEVEHIVGLSKKSIRFYEQNGLLTPKRNDTNDYRIYTKEDIEKLKKIKFLRDLGVPIRELRLLNENKISLKNCLEDRLAKIEREQEKYETIKSMCRQIIESECDFVKIEIETHFEKMNILGKEGFTLRDTKTSKGKKIFGAAISSIIFSMFFVFLIVLISYFQFTEPNKLPWLLYAFLMFVLGTPFTAIVINLISRIREILGGEEDEASKY